jgi:hypothetical protein
LPTAAQYLRTPAFPVRDNARRNTIDAKLAQDLHDALGQLTLTQQRQVLDYARTLAQGRPRGTPGSLLTALESPIQPDDLKLMAEAIEEEFGDKGKAAPGY